MNYFVGDENRKYSKPETDAKLRILFPEHYAAGDPHASARFSGHSLGIGADEEKTQGGWHDPNLSD